MKRAVIDMGTNTFNLLVGTVEDGRLRIDYKTKQAVLLGMDGINEGVLCLAAIERAKNALLSFRLDCDRFGVREIVAIGTSAMRSVNNTKDLVEYANSIGINVTIVSGAQEANYIFNGVSWLTEGIDAALIMDIGGGSTEFISFEENKIKSSHSLDIGVSRIYQELDKPVNFSNDDYVKIYKFFDKEKNIFNNDTSSALIGASGSFETLFELINKRHYVDSQKMEVLDLNKVKESIDWILASTLQERTDNKWILPYRREMLPIAALKVKWVLDYNKIDKVYLSPYSLKEGVFKFNELFKEL